MKKGPFKLDKNKFNFGILGFISGGAMAGKRKGVGAKYNKGVAAKYNKGVGAKYNK